MKRKIVMLLMALSMTALLFGCGKEEKTTPNEVPKQEESVGEKETVKKEQEETTQASKDGMVRSYLTGEWIDEEIAAKRPYAVMIGNTVDALPQYGLSEADVIYEVPVEASYTRLMAIFQDVTGLEKIGSTRSCRHYFVNFAREFDAIYVHYGQAVYAEPLLAQDNIHNINGMDASVESICFYRDNNRKAPHNAFTSEKGLKAATEKKGYRTEYADTYEGHYQFAKEGKEVTLKKGTDALVVSPGYFVNKPWFVYDEATGLYNRFEFNKEHIDGGTEGQLQVKNIIVQYCNWDYMDQNGYLDISTVPLTNSGVGEGKYITNGKMIDITWTKEDADSPAKYFDAEGKEITLNVGKTWVCIARDGYQDRFQVFQTEEELQTAR